MVGLSPSHIRDLTHIRYQKVIKTNGSIPPPTKRGRPTIASNDILSRIMCLTIQNRASPCWKTHQLLMQEGIIDISAASIWRYRNC